MTTLHGRRLRAFTVGGAVLCGLTLLSLPFFQREPKPPAEAPRQSPRPVAPSAQTRRPTPDLRPSTPTPRETQTDPMGEMLGELATSEDYQGSLSLLKQSILKEDERLALINYYHEHVLLDSASREKYRELLADPQVLAHIQRGLLYPPETRESLRGNIQRLMQLDYLRDALTWKENPQRGTLLARVEEMILTDNLRAEQTRGLHLSLAGNKLELYELLYEQDPKRAEALVSSARGSPLEAMVDQISQYNQRRLAREHELSLAVGKR